MFSGIDFLLKRTMSSFFDAIKNLLTAYHIDKSLTGKIIEPIKQDSNAKLRWSFCLHLKFCYKLNKIEWNFYIFQKMNTILIFIKI
ncbi:hypothetical protein AO203_05050 [Lactobacillus gallinarum]|nr:hypothetical protein AO203_05050 [Lactobacillus gallinarum]